MVESPLKAVGIAALVILLSQGFSHPNGRQNIYMFTEVLCWGLGRQLPRPQQLARPWQRLLHVQGGVDPRRGWFVFLESKQLKTGTGAIPTHAPVQMFVVHHSKCLTWVPGSP